ncbi:MAG: sensor histidine kinase [Bacteroidetes bacterium]|nr:sensor histidine kinase [Bacteroidota bacterium]
MKYYCLFIFILIFIIPVRSQPPAIDSLLAITQSSQNPQKIMDAYYRLASMQVSFDDNMLYARKGLAIAVHLNDSIAMGKFYQTLAGSFYFKGIYDSTASYYYRSVELLEKKNAFTDLAYTYNGLAKLFRKTGNYERAHQFYDKAMDLFVRLKDKRGISLIYNESGVVYEYEKNYAAALQNYQSSLEICKQLNDQLGISYAMNFMAGVYVIQENFKEAEKNNLAALAIREKLKDTLSIALIYTDLGAMYLAEKNYEKAKSSYLKSIDLIAPKNYPDLMMINYKELADIATANNDPMQALQYFKKSADLKDSIYKISSAKQVEELSAKYETAEKEKQILHQQLEITKRNYWITGFIALLILLSALGFSWYRRYSLKQQSKLQSAIITQQSLTTQAVIVAEENERKRIAGDLHDGIGQMMSAAKMNLSALESEIHFESEKQKRNYEKIVSLVDESCREVRTVSHNMMPNALMAGSLPEALNKFIDRLYRNEVQIQLHTEGMDKGIDANTSAVLYRIIQECVNNVLKHAQATRLDISILKDEDGVNATIEDNGVGFHTEDLNHFNGIGLKNILRRISYLKGKVDWHSKPGNGTLVAIYVPIEENT